MSVNNTGDRIGTSSRGYLKTTRFYTGSIRLLFILAVYFYFFISAEGQLVDRIKYYDVTGKTTAEFTANWVATIRAQGFQGYCLWQPVMKHSFTKTRQGFKASSLDLKVYVTLTLPRVKFPDEMPTSTRHEYSQQIQHIYNHEYAHRKYKIQFYNEFLRLYNRLPAYRTQEGLYGATNALLWKLHRDTVARDAFFDMKAH